MISSPKDAFDHGIGMIHQHFKLVNVFSAAQNIILGINEAEGKKVLFTGDLSDQLSYQDFPCIALEESTDVIISEFAHFRYIQMEPYLEKCKILIEKYSPSVLAQ